MSLNKNFLTLILRESQVRAGGIKDGKKSCGLYEQAACNAGNFRGCAVLGVGLRNGHPVIAKVSRPPLQSSDEKVIERQSFSNEPFRFGDLSIRNTRITLAVKFSARQIAEAAGGKVDDWLEHLSFTIKNKSNKRIIYINLELDFPETAVNGSMMVYNQLGIGIHPRAFGEGLKYGTPLALEPDEITTFSLSSDRERLVEEFLATRNFQIANLNRVVIRIDQVIYDDGMKWSQGTEYKPNSAVRGGYEPVNPRMK